MYKVKKLVCTLLAVCIISTTLAQPVQAFTGAEGAILGGGAGLASISLTAPQVALLVAAGFGLVVAVENADKLAEGMTTALNSAAAGVDAGAETLAQWLETAKKGSIAIASAPAWIAAALKGWISGLYNTTVPSVDFAPFITVNAGEEFAHVNPASSTKRKIYSPSPVSVNVSWAAQNVLSSDGVSRSLLFVQLCWTDGSYFEVQQGSSYYSSKPINIDGKTYRFSLSTYGFTVNPNNSDEFGLKSIDYASSLPDWQEFLNKYNNTSIGDVETRAANTMLRACLAGEYQSLGNSVCPDSKVGGIGSVLEEGKSIDDVNMPDLDIAGSKSICPDGVLDGSIPIADTVADLIVGLTDGTLSWSDYVTDVAVGTPTISVPVEGTETGVIDYPITDTGVSDTPIEENPDTPGEGTGTPEGLAPYTVDLKDFFPFCIPFDIVDFVGVLCADPVAPSFEWTFTQYSGQKDTLEIDLAPFDEVAQLLRNMELLLFIIGLAFLTRNLIRG